MPKKVAIACDDEEAQLALLLLNAAVSIWNWRERRSAPRWFDTAWPVGGISFIAHPSYEVCFTHLASGRVYGIVAPRYDPYVTEPLWSFRRVPLDQKLVRRVERLLSFEKAPKSESTIQSKSVQSAP